MDYLKNKVNFNILKHKNFLEIKRELELSDKELINYINMINNENSQSVPVIINNDIPKIAYNKREFEIQELKRLKRNLKILITSDKHIDHIDDRVEYINDLYEEAEKRSIDYVFDLGDVLNGPACRVHQPEKSRTGTLEGCLEQLQKYHPNNLKTYFITGNHDLKFMDNDNCDIGRVIESCHNNFKFLGNLFACININGFRINISHGSYESKILSSIKLNKEFPFLTNNDPHVICQGHFHISNKPIYNEALLCQVPTLKASSDKEKKGTSGHPGAIFLNLAELSDCFEVEYEEVKFIEEKKLVKNEIIIKKTRIDY